MNDERPFDETAPERIDDPARADSSLRPGAPDGSTAVLETEAVEAQAAHRPLGGRRIAALGAGAALIFAAGAGTGVAGTAAFGGSTTSTSSAQGTGGMPGGSQGTFGGTQGGLGTQGGFGGQTGNGPFGQGGGPAAGGSSTGRTSSTRSTEATAAQSKGVVTIVSELGYQSGESAGTGIVLTPSGEVLTNNHVIAGATSIKVTDGTSGRTYTATVVGTNAKKDVAVLQLRNASGLATATISEDSPSVGDSVTAVGNAGGTGTLTAAEGTVTALDQTITTSAEGSAAGETLHGLIETDADVVSGDSGGPLTDADGEVIGIDTAASSGSSDPTGYAIPIGDALDVATQILAGDDTADITIGSPAFLGVALSPTGDGTTVSGVFDDTPAASAGIAEGDVITRVGGSAVSSADELRTAISAHKPGERVTIAWESASGATHRATVTLIAGPAD